ncbi:DEAD/DEAH box helicase family protein [Sulfurimonas sp. HSL1-2]|uniref:type III restriction-modification system endonuclease n=1 Tax=Thiomicrolovo zhangzhouensis TaxID=3131933 RepID=UPI0031F7D954
MKIRFKKQPYQTHAVESVVECFKGQLKSAGLQYRVDPGKRELQKGQQTSLEDFAEETPGFKNSELSITPLQLLQNIQEVQRNQNLPASEQLVKTSVCDVNLDVEMETGTGKTYVYTKTMFELHRRYGWNKFIIVVPSIAIREGVYQSMELTKEHFLQEYGTQAKTFIYNSKDPHELESFATDAGINVMIINVQAFNATGKDARRIYEELDGFGSRRPIDVIKANRPILIIDEPQKIEGDAKKETKSFQSLKEFNPLFILRYSATFRKTHNKVHRLDALDAYNQKLVKKIAVRGISVKGLSGTNAYLYLQSIEISASKPPVARLELEVKRQSGIKREMRKIAKGDNLFDKSEGLEQYRGFVVSDIDAAKDIIYFTNGVELQAGEATGDVNEATLRRIQIKETIKAHLEKEQELYYKGVKVLSLFFIDEVAKYRVYGEDGEKESGEYAKIFEEEYANALNEIGTLHLPEYREYLAKIDVNRTHEGYFSIDKKSKQLVDPKIQARGEAAGQADDVDAYDLILKNKKRLLSLDEPVRFIFSHSALREGWDNPNVFVICTLKHSDNTISRRQEVGRGMRISVDKHGERMDDPATVHQTNVLTVIANESYKDFVSGLQKDISESLSERPRVADEEYFTGKVLNTAEGKINVDAKMAKLIYRYLVKNDYTDDNDNITSIYHDAKREEQLAALPDELKPYEQEVFALIDTVFSDAMLPDITDGRKEKTNHRNDNFKKKEFQKLWSRMNRKAVYTVHFKSDELVQKCINALDKELHVKALTYVIERGGQKDAVTYDEMKSGSGFETANHDTVKDTSSIRSAVKYDLIGKLASDTKLTRQSIGKILQGIHEGTFNQYRTNPEDFIHSAARLINEQKATTVIEHLSYDPINQHYEVEEIFTENQSGIDFSRAKKVNNHIYDFVITDSKTEATFAEQLDTSNEVVVYAKLPKSFFIPTPVGHYNPDWAIAFKEGSVKHVYFIAETKGSMSSMELRKVEEVRIECARKFFKTITSEQVKYDVVDSYEKLMQLVE